MIILNKSGKLFAGSLLFIIIILVIVFRSGDRFSDVNNYIGMYNSAINVGSANTEFSFILLSKISDFMGFSYLGMFLIYGLISISSKYIFLKTFISQSALALILYGVSYFILYELVQMRVGAAFGVFLCSLIFYSRGDMFKSLLICFLASFLHYSVIPLALLLFLSPFFLRVKRNQFLGLSVAGIVFLSVTVFAVLYFILMIFFSALDFRVYLIDVIDSALNWILPSRLYEGYFGSDFFPVTTLSMKMVLSVVLTIISIFVLLCGFLKKEWIYYFSCLMVIFSFWVYLFFGHLGVFSERLAEILLLFIIVVLDGTIKGSRTVGLFLFFIVFSVFLLNLLTRASYFKLL